MFGAAKRDKLFKDYCLILQVHPEADAAMIDAAYWHLAKRYNEAAAYDSQAKAKLEELNEAYIVLGSATRREEYMKIRAQVLGEGALPQAPKPAPPAPPLAVMTRQQPREREIAEAAKARRRLLSLQSIAGLFVALCFTGVALAATVSPWAAVTVVAVALVTIVVAAGAVVTFSRLSDVPSNRARALQRKTTHAALKKVRTHAPQARAPQQPVGAEAPQVSDTEDIDPQDLPEIVSTEMPREAHLEPSPEPGREAPEGLKNIRQQAAAFRKIAQSQGATPAAVREDVEVDAEQSENIRRKTERLKSIAARFNAAKAATKPDDPEAD